MKTVFFLILFFSYGSSAHEHHGEELKASSALSGSSLWQLGSNWKNQQGKVQNLAELNGQNRLVLMLFTKCETACPLLVEDLKDIAKAVSGKASKKIEVTLFSLDSFRETPESLAAFAEKRNLPAHWQLYTSDASAVAELAAALGVRYKRLPSGDFIHSNVIYFLNEKGEVLFQQEGIKKSHTEFVKQIKSKI